MAEIGIAVATAVAPEVAKSLYQTIKKEICYVFKYQSNIDDLKNQVRQLGHKSDREQVRVDHAKRQGDQIHNDFEEWLTKVNEFMLNEVVIQVANPNNTGDEGREKIACFNVIARYKLSKKAEKAAKSCYDLLAKNFGDVAYRPRPQRTVSIYIDRDHEKFDSRESILQEILEALKDPNVNKIGVYGMGGVGKTTLVKNVAWQAVEVYKIFDEVVIADVTQKPDNRKIREKIASDLGLEFEQHENEFDRARRLRNKLKKEKRVLVILDNIWAKPDLEAIGIPSGEYEKERVRGKEDCRGINNDQSQRLYKILLTSRRLDILRNDMKTEKNFSVEALCPEESQNLFWKIVGENHSAKSSTDFRTAADIVGKCAGLPLALATIASALKNRSIDVWEDALNDLKTGNPRRISEVDERVVPVLELSFNLLRSDEAKKLFLLCSLVDCDHGTSYDDLLRYSMGWGLFQNVYTLKTGRKSLNKLIDDLKASCLLLEGDSNSRVKMHEFVHAVAISIASTSSLMFTIQDVPDLNRALEEKMSKNPTAISLPYRDISRLPERLGFPKLELFFLFMKYPSLGMSNDFFEGTKQLKVIDCTGINLQSLPSSLANLMNLQTLCLDDCLLGDIATIGDLKNLEILSFSRSSIKMLPKEIGKLTRLKLLDLKRCSKLQVIAPNVISRLSRLEELYLDDTFIQWENEYNNQDGRNANLDELNQLSHLTTLNINFSDAEIIPPNLCFQQLETFRILIGDTWNWSYRNEASRTLKLKLNNNNFLGFKPIKILLKRTEELFLDEFNGVDQSALYELDEEGFLNLKYLHVQNCSGLLYIVNSAGQIPRDAFPMLEFLCLDGLINLETICHGLLKETSFNQLKTIQVDKCDGLKHLFSIYIAKSLLLLQEIKVTDCKNLIAIFAEEDKEGCLYNESETNIKIVFPQLHTLTFERLPQVTSFSFNKKTLFATERASTEITTADDHKNFKTLFSKKVEYRSLQNLKLSSISIEKIWPEQLLSIASYCQTVKSLTLEDCNGLKFLFSSSVVTSFAQLHRLMISNCQSMVRLIETRGLEGAEIINFPNLYFLELKDLPNVTRFGNGNIIEFPSLNQLIIVNCPNLRMMNEPEEMNLVQNLRADKEPFFNDKVRLPSLETLQLCEMYNLRKIWDEQLSLDSFCKIKFLVVKKCNKLLNIFSYHMVGRLERLESLDVESCHSLEEIFELQYLSDGKTPAIAATQLRELHLCVLPSLKHVWNMDAQAILAFGNLIKIRVHSCRSLTSLFPASVANGLLKLSHLEIHSCLLGEVIAKEENVDEAVIPRFMFPRLNSLCLRALPQLKTFYPERYISEWPVLKTMEVFRCLEVKILVSELQHQLGRLQSLFLIDKVAFPSLEALKLSHLPELLHLWGGNSQPNRVFQNLQTLELSACEKIKTLVPSSVFLWNLETLDVSKCGGLTSLVTLTTAKSLVNLRRINVVDCKMIEEIVTHVGDKANNDDQIILKQLNFLLLNQLPSLTSFCSLGNHANQFPSLEKVIVGNCPKMVMLEKQNVKEGDDLRHLQDNLESTGQELFKEMVELQGLQYLKISEFPQLTKVWHDQLLPDNFFCNLTSLLVDKCAHMSRSISGNLLRFLNNLEMLEVRNCDLLEQVFDLEELSLSVDRYPRLLPQLSHFYVIDLLKLTHIGRGSYHEILGFRSLKFLEVQNCCCLTYIFTASIFSGLEQLQEMKIINCAMMKVIIEKVWKEDATDKIVLPLLNSITLESLPELTSFYSGRNILECPSLKTITIRNCTKMKAFVFTDMDPRLHTQPFFSDKAALPNLKILDIMNMDNLRKIWYDQLNLNSFSKFEQLIVCHCSKLENIFPSIVHGRLQALHNLDVVSCESLEGIFEVQELSSGRTEAMSVGRLENLHLCDLPKLKHVWNLDAQAILCSENLQSVKVHQCPGLKYLFPTSIAKSLRQLEKYEIHSCLIEEIVAKDEEFTGTDPRFVFPQLTSLSLEGLPRLKNFYPGIHISEWPSLNELQIYECDEVKIFASESQKRRESQHDNPNQHPLFLVDKVALPNLTKLDIMNMGNLRKIWSDELNLNSFGKLEDLSVWNCSKLENIFPSIMHGRLQALHTFSIVNCESLERIFEAQELGCGRTEAMAVGRLEQLHLCGLPKLKHAWNLDAQAVLCSENLQAVHVHHCPSLKHLFPTSIARGLLQLKELEIKSCLIEEIVAKDEEFTGTDPRFVFPQVTSLSLRELPQLKHFYPGIHISEWPSLNELKIYGCDEVKIFASEFQNRGESQHDNPIHHDNPLFLVDKIAFPSLDQLELFQLPELLHLWKENSQPSEVFPNLATLKVSECDKLMNIAPSSVSFQNLTTLEVSKCDGLISLVTSPTARSMMQLTRMEISNCKIVEQIITVEALDNEVKNDIVFKELEYLGLDSLPSLRIFCSENCALEFPSLNQVIVRGCSKMETFSQGVSSASRLQTAQLTEEEDGGCWQGDLNTAIQQMVKEMKAQFSTD